MIRLKNILKITRQIIPLLKYFRRCNVTWAAEYLNLSKFIKIVTYQSAPIHTFDLERRLKEFNIFNFSGEVAEVAGL